MATLTSMAELSDELRRRLGPTWLRIVAYLREHNAIDDVANAIRVGNYDGAIVGITEAAAHWGDAVVAAQQIAGQQASSWLGDQLDQLVSFDRTNHAAVAAMNEARVDAIRAVTNDTRETVRSIITDGVANGDNPRVIARDVREVIGLTPAQAGYVDNFRSELERGDWSAAGSRELIDGRWQRTFDRLARDGTELAPAQIDTMVQRYTDNMVTWRAETIARTEGLRAAHSGYQQGFQQAVNDGRVESHELIQTWKHTNHGRYARVDHERMNNQQRPFGVPFLSGSGALLMFPCDPDAPPGETINCRCIVTTRYVPSKFQAANMSGMDVVAGRALDE
jgi:hypothetical protein